MRTCAYHFLELVSESSRGRVGLQSTKMFLFETWLFPKVDMLGCRFEYADSPMDKSVV